MEIISQPFVDLNASESTGQNEGPVSMKKKVRITISTAESCSENQLIFWQKGWKRLYLHVRFKFLLLWTSS